MLRWGGASIPSMAFSTSLRAPTFVPFVNGFRSTSIFDLDEKIPIAIQIDGAELDVAASEEVSGTREVQIHREHLAWLGDFR